MRFIRKISQGVAWSDGVSNPGGPVCKASLDTCPHPLVEQLLRTPSRIRTGGLLVEGQASYR